MDFHENEIDCACAGIPYEQLIKTIKDKNCKDVQDVQKCHSRVGKGCGICKPFIQKWCDNNKS
jgi:NAD(P)H-nitrite reductase large subunit